MLLALTLIFMLCGCSAFLVLPTETIRAPRTTGEYENIRNALEEAVGSDIVMKYPKCGSSSASFASGDVDGDGQTEMLAFYQKADNASATHINILKAENGKWKSVGDIAPVGSELVTVLVSDLDRDGAAEIISGWSVYDSKNYELAIFSDKGGAIVQRTSEKYTDFLISDCNGDKTDEIVILLLSALDKTSEIYFYDLSESELSMIAKSSLDGTVVSYGNITEQKLLGGQMCYYIDGYKGNGAMVTDVITFKNGNLINLFYDESVFATMSTYRPFELSCKSDGGKILVPFVRTVEIGIGSGIYQNLIDWKYYNGEEMLDDYTTYFCSEGGYELKLSYEWQTQIFMSYLNDARELVAYEYVSAQTPVSELFRIKEFSLDDEKNPIGDVTGYSLIINGESSAYYAKAVPENGLGVTAETVRQQFLLEEE